MASKNVARVVHAEDVACDRQRSQDRKDLPTPIPPPFHLTSVTNLRADTIEG